MTFFCSLLDFGQKIGIVFICVDLCGVRNNKLLNLGVRDLKKVENHWRKGSTKIKISDFLEHFCSKNLVPNLFAPSYVD